jgi:hypothetical protein
MCWWRHVGYERGVWKASKDQDPLPAWAEGEAKLNEALKVSPSFHEAFMRRGLLRMSRAAWRESKGEREAALADWKAAAADFEQTLAVNPNFKHLIGERLEKARRKAVE